MAENKVIDFLRVMIKRGAGIQKIEFQPFTIERGKQYDDFVERQVKVELEDGEIELGIFTCTKDRFIKWQIETGIFLKNHWGM